MSTEMPIKEAGPISEVERSEAPQTPVRRFLAVLGPGLVTGASDDDPSGIGTYAQAGAQFGFGPLWTALFTFPLMAVVQYICAKIGLVTGHGLTGVLFKHFPRSVLYFAVGGLVVANTLNAGADIGAIAAAVHLLIPQIPLGPTIVLTSLGIIALLMFGSYRVIARIFKWLTLSLFAYVIAALFTHANLRDAIAHTLIPTINLSSQYLAVLVGILGTTISPYLFFWQSDSEVEQARAMSPESCFTMDRTRFWRKRSGQTIVPLAKWFVESYSDGYFLVQTAKGGSPVDPAACCCHPVATNYLYGCVTAASVQLRNQQTG